MEHPHGVQPQMGLFGDGGDAAASARARGLGALGALPDEVVMAVLHELRPTDLARLATLSRHLWAFCNHDELWKGFCLDVRRWGPAGGMPGVASCQFCRCSWPCRWLHNSLCCGGRAEAQPPSPAPPPPTPQELEGRWDFAGTWQDTYLQGTVPGYAPGARKLRRAAGVQSDLLYTPWL